MMRDRNGVRTGRRGQSTPVIMIILVLFTILLAGVVYRYWDRFKGDTMDDDPDVQAQMVFAFEKVNVFPCEENLCGGEGDLCINLRNGGSETVSIRALGRMNIRLLSTKTSKTRVIMPSELYVYYSEDERPHEDGNSYPLCCNLTDPEVRRVSRCYDKSGVLSNKRITIAFNTTSYDEYMEEIYSFRYEG